MSKWKADTIPQYGLTLKYLRLIMPERELEELIKRYVAAKQKHFTEKSKAKKSNA